MRTRQSHEEPHPFQRWGFFKRYAETATEAAAVSGLMSELSERDERLAKLNRLLTKSGSLIGEAHALTVKGD